MPRRSAVKLTRRTVEALRAGDREYLVWDRDLPGFGVRVHATGRKTYVVQSRGPGGLRRASIARHGDVSAQIARKKAARMIDRIKQGKDPVEKPAEPEPTVAELAERYWEVHVQINCNSKTAELYRGAIDNHILPALGAMPIGAVRRQDAWDLNHRLRGTPCMANNVMRVLSKMYRLAEHWGLMPAGRNPCRSIRLYRVRARERYLTLQEYGRVGEVLRAAETDGSVWASAIAALRLLMLTGCRRDEILTLRWEDVDRTVGELRLRRTKTGPRTVPITPDVERVLAGISRSAGNPWVIAGRQPRTRLTHLRYYWAKVRERAGLGDVRIHDLRHSYASHALALGESLSLIARLVGHARIASTLRYAHLMRDSEKQAAARVGDSIAAHIARIEADSAHADETDEAQDADTGGGTCRS